MPKVTVYVSAADARSLQQDGEDPAKWVREMVKKLLTKRREGKADEER